MKRDTPRNKLLTIKNKLKGGGGGGRNVPGTKSARPLMSTDKAQNGGITVLYT